LPEVLRSFSALPGPLRDLLGPRLATRLISMGAADAAAAVRNAITRKESEPIRAATMIDAKLALEGGHADSAVAELEDLSKGNDALATEALKLAVRARLDSGAPIDPAQVDEVAALAFARQDSAEGPEFATLEVAARAASSDFVEAFASYLRWQEIRPDQDRAEMALYLFSSLATLADDTTFLTQYFGHRSLLAEAGPHQTLTMAVAERLGQLGFFDEVEHLLADQKDQSVPMRLMLAQAALGRYAPDLALERLSGLPGPEAARLRAAAYEQAGDHLAAARTYSELGDGPMTSRAAWSGGDWQIAAATNPEYEAAALSFGLEASGAELPQAGDPASLEVSRALLDESAGLRGMLSTLLAPRTDGP
ncbi:MAG: hypothetical protein WBA91_13550, partial [Paracoccaceae bacterium]